MAKGYDISNLGFEKDKKVYDKNITFRITKEASSHLKEMLDSSSLNNSEFITNFILDCYRDFFDK